MSMRGASKPRERGVAVAVAALACVVAACGGNTPPPENVEPPHQEDTQSHAPPLQMKSELGTVEPGDIDKSFKALDEKLLDCQKRGLDRVEVLSGPIKFFIRIGGDGSTKWVFVEQSQLGDRDTEKCMLDVVSGGQWPKPQGGGEAEAHKEVELPLQTTRDANQWNADKISNALGKSGDAIDKCKGGSSGPFQATMYVGPGGKVLAAGIATSSRDDADKVDCLVKALQKMKGLPSPGGWPAKVSFGL
jgi:hypothetical protein